MVQGWLSFEQDEGDVRLQVNYGSYYAYLILHFVIATKEMKMSIIHIIHSNSILPV